MVRYSSTKESVSCLQFSLATHILVVVVEGSWRFFLNPIIQSLVIQMRKVQLVLRAYQARLELWQRLAAVCQARTAKIGGLLD
jgi:hypothetical protein